mgnify:CR=1 FL=1|jgi:hypothetical protein
MTEQEFLKIKHPRPEHASKYLDGKITAENIRCLAIQKECTFCQAFKTSAKSRRYTYIVNPEALFRYKKGEEAR